MLSIDNIRFGMRIFLSDLKRRKKGFKQYEGNARQICNQIIKDCWSDKYFKGSAGHFSDFWLRDFCFSLKGLIKMGYKEECKKTLRYALKKYEEYDDIATIITPKGKPNFNITFGWENVAYILRCIIVLKDYESLETHREFLNSKVAYYFEKFVEKDTGLPIKGYSFTSMKDFAKRKQACVDVCFLAETKKNLEILGLNNPFKNYNYKKLLIEKYWTGNYFLDDLSGRRYLSGDANVIPFWLGLIKDRKMLNRVIKAFEKHKFDKPMPLKYTHHAEEGINFHIVEIFLSGYEKSATWPQLGLMYISLIKKYDRKKAKRYMDKFKKVIESYKNFPELFTHDMKPFKTPFYYCDEGMIWAAMYIELDG